MTTTRAAALAALTTASTPAELVAARRDLERAAGGMLAVYTPEESAALLASRAWVVESGHWTAGDAPSVDPEGDLDVSALDAEIDAETARSQQAAWEDPRPVGAYPTETMALAAARAAIVALRDHRIAVCERASEIERECLRISEDGLSLRFQTSSDAARVLWCEMLRVRRAEGA